MIEGIVSAELLPMISLALLDEAGNRFFVNAVIDTGYNRSLVLPRTLIESLGFRHSGFASATLADGRTEVHATYEGRVIWNEQERKVPVDSSESSPLVGSMLLYGSKVMVEMMVGGKVEITPLPPPTSTP